MSLSEGEPFDASVISIDGTFAQIDLGTYGVRSFKVKHIHWDPERGAFVHVTCGRATP
jgi:hypothetical protein